MIRSKTIAVGTIAASLLGGLLIAMGLGRIGLYESFWGEGGLNKTPKAITEDLELNLGTLVQQGIREVEFVVCNEGGRRLVVTRENRGCCGRLDASSSLVVMPGDSVKIRELVDTSTWCGHLRQEFSYRTNDPQQPLLTFTVVAEVVVPENRRS